MMGAIDQIVRGYNYLIHDLADPRTKDWILVSNPWPIAGLLAFYLYFSTRLGPQLMKDRQPFKLKNTLIVYNIFQIILSTYIFFQALRDYIREYNIICEPVDFSYSRIGLKAAHLSWMYYFGKMTELLDTVFFVLRKKNNQVTTLHVYHHFFMAGAGFYGTRYYPGGHAALFGLLNCFVHMIMYTYYLIAGLGPQYQKYLWWKRYITILQLSQFFIIFFHNIFQLFSAGCGYPKHLHLLFVVQAVVFFYMFGQFYINTYIKKPKQNDKRENIYENNKVKNRGE